MQTQDDVFFVSEGDQWFKRNKERLIDPLKVEQDWPLLLLKQAEILPKRILEVGCSNGWRLGALKQRYACECVGVDPSLAALQDGGKRFSDVLFKQGLVSSLPFDQTEKFDVVSVNFVLHWVSRETLFHSLAEIDRMVAEGGYLIIGDFLPDAPKKTPYQHLPEGGVHTYKLDYSRLFEASALYTLLIRYAFNEDEKRFSPQVTSQSRGVCSLLRKSLEEFYQ